MSLFDYEASQELAANDYPFYSLIMAAMRKADSTNELKLRDAWPEVWEELFTRYNAPGGYLPEEMPRATRTGCALSGLHIRRSPADQDRTGPSRIHPDEAGPT